MSVYTIFTLSIMFIPLMNCFKYSIKANRTEIVECTTHREFKNNTLQINVMRNTSLILKKCPVMDDVSLIKSFNISGAANIEELTVINSTLQISYPNRIFDGLESLKVLRLFVKSIDPGIFANLSKIEYLQIRLLMEKEFNKDEIDYLTKTIISSLNKDNNALASETIESILTRQIPDTSKIELNILDKEILEGLNNLQVLDLHETGIDILSPDVFSVLPKLESLNLEYNNITELPRNLLHRNNKLRQLKIGYNCIQIVPVQFLSHLIMLEKVSMKDNDLMFLSESLFKRLTKIKHIALQSNVLQNIPENLFQDQLNLEELYVQENNLKELPDKLFKNTPNLRKVFLSHNKIGSLSRNVFSSLGKLLELRLDHNNLQYIDPFTFNNAVKLRKLDFSNNNLTSLTSNSNTLEHPHLSNTSNNQTTVYFNNWKNMRLKELNLFNNRFTTFSISDLQFESSDISINLTFNSISKILPETLQDLQWNSSKSHITVEIADNLMTCDQLKYTIGLIEPTLNKQITFKINSKTCAETIYDPLQILQIQFNPFCPENCTCSVQDENYVIVVDCMGNNMMKIPQLPQPLEINLFYILHVENNSITELPSVYSPNETGYDAVVELHARHNSIHALAVENLPPNIRAIDISYNKLVNLSESVLNMLNGSDQMNTLKLSGNDWQCECSSSLFLNFVQQNHKKISDVEKVLCNNGDKLISITVSDLCKDNIRNIKTIVFVVAIFGLLGALAPALYYKFELQLKIWLFKHNFFRVSEEEMDKHKPYDAFLSYSHNDVDFVINHLIPTLESEPMNFKICWDARDWTPGELIDSQIHKSIESSRRTIILLSKHFLESVWAQMEFRTAYLKSVAEKRARVIVIIYGDIGDIDDLDCELKTYLKMNTYVRWDDRWFWDKLRYSMPHPLRFYS